MTTASDIISNAKRIRASLRNPPNAVIDTGINLKRKKENPLPLKVEEKKIDPLPPILVNPIPGGKPVIPFRRVSEVVCRSFNVTISDIKDRSRRSYLVYPRHLIMYLSYKYCYPRLSLPAVANRMNRDHTTVLHAVRRIQVLMVRNGGVKERVSELEAQILG